MDRRKGKEKGREGGKEKKKAIKTDLQVIQILKLLDMDYKIVRFICSKTQIKRYRISPENWSL